MTAPMTVVARPSAASLFLVLQKNGVEIGTATAFVVQHDGVPYLVTNRHVVLGKGGLPDVLVVVHNKEGQLGQYEPKVELLYDQQGKPRWYEHPTLSQAVDVAVLPLTNLDGVDLHGYDPWNPGPGLRAGITDPLNIIGFPFGVAGGALLGIWVRGFVASEPLVDWSNLPCFLIDSRTRPGQSGSPVIAYSGGGMVPLVDGSTAVFGGPVEQFFGVYSGRIAEESDLGIVWKASALRDVIENVPRPAKKPPAKKKAVSAKKVAATKKKPPKKK